MALSTTTTRVSFSGNGVTTVFSFPYYFLANADLVVISKVTSTGVETTKTLTTHYTISGAGASAGGSVTMLVAPVTGTTLTIYRDPAKTQDLDLAENDPMPAEEVEERFDKAMMIDQRLGDRLDRAVRLTDGFSATFDPKLPAILTADTVIKINAAGTAFEIGPTITDVSSAAANATAAAASASAASTSASGASASAVAAAASAVSAAAALASAVTSVGTIDTGTPHNNGAQITSNALILQSASATKPGLVNLTTQTLAGVKTFSSAPNLSSLSASLPLKLDGSKNVLAQAVALGGSEISGTLAIGNGGTGQTTAAAAYAALKPTQQEVRLRGVNGRAAVNVEIMLWTTIDTNVGTDITYATSANNGASFTINTAGVYALFLQIKSSQADVPYIVLNQTAITAVTSATTLAAWEPTANNTGLTSVTCYLAVSDVVRFGVTGSGTLSNGQVRVVRVG